MAYLFGFFVRPDIYDIDELCRKKNVRGLLRALRYKKKGDEFACFVRARAAEALGRLQDA